MKKFLFAAFALLLINSCSKSSTSPTTTNNLSDKISAKWNIENSSDYESVEFNKSGNYIIVPKIQTRSPKEVLFGTYEIIDGKVILSDFGTITVSNVDGKTISMLIKLISNPNEEVKLNGVKQSEMASSKSVDLLCRTWLITSRNGESVNDQQTALVSKAGTYFLASRGGTPSFWKLKDNDKILYYHPEIHSGFDDSRYMTITELTIDKLITTENGVITELKPFKK
jgi:hypothetical protein